MNEKGHLIHQEDFKASEYYEQLYANEFEKTSFLEKYAIKLTQEEIENMNKSVTLNILNH